jgi:hypothetical protein
MPPSVNLAPPPHPLPPFRAQVVTVARWQKVRPKSSNVAEEIMRMQKMMVKIVLNFTKSSRKSQKKIFNNNVTFENFFFKYEEHNRMLWLNFFENCQNLLV